MRFIFLHNESDVIDRKLKVRRHLPHPVTSQSVFEPHVSAQVETNLRDSIWIFIQLISLGRQSHSSQIDVERILTCLPTSCPLIRKSSHYYFQLYSHSQPTRQQCFQADEHDCDDAAIFNLPASVVLDLYVRDKNGDDLARE
jgi:hypothetical protein